jgi:hypothetical protein
MKLGEDMNFLLRFKKDAEAKIVGDGYTDVNDRKKEVHSSVRG